MALTNPKATQPSKEEREAELIRYGIKMLAITIMFIFGSMSSCTMMPEFVDADTAKVKEAEYKGKVAIAEQQHKEAMAKIASIEKLIKEEKVNPVAARCAVNGWDRNDSVCEKLVASKKPANVRKETNN